MFASPRVGSDPRDGLTICQLHPYRLPGEEVVVSRFKGAQVGVSLGGGEKDSEWRARLHNLRPYGSGGERDHQLYMWCMSLRTCFWMKYLGYLLVGRWSSLLT